MAERSLVEQEQQWCRHYNGAFSGGSQPDKVCEAGVTYTSLVPRGPGWLTRLPCIRSNTTDVICPLLSLYSDEEAQARAEESARIAAEYLRKVFVERQCPQCSKVYQGRQVGPCVYCEHCGTRLYQGTL